MTDIYCLRRRHVRSNICCTSNSSSILSAISSDNFCQGDKSVAADSPMEMEMETSERALFSRELIARLTEPAKFKIKFYHVAILMYMDQILALIVTHYALIKVKIEEKRSQLTVKVSGGLEQSPLDKQKLHRSLLVVRKRTEHVFINFQSMHRHCITHKETPELFCEPYIHNGFRPINQPYWYYVKSLFTKHNETVNAWSHYLGAIYTLTLAFRLDFSDPYSWPILTSLITSVAMFFSSATAHLMHQKSHLCHMTCFLCDFGGISFNAFGASLMQIYVCSPVWYYKALEPYLLPLLGAQSALCCLLNSVAQTNYKRPYPAMKRLLQFAPCGLLWLFSMLPLLVALVWPDTDGAQRLRLDYAWHAVHIGTFLVGSAFFALDFPQRFFPGRLDFFGQGHNIFHLCVFLVITVQLKSVYADYLANRAVIAASRLPPTFAYCFVSLACLTVYYVYLIRSFYQMIKHNFDNEGNLIAGKSKKKHH